MCKKQYDLIKQYTNKCRSDLEIKIVMYKEIRKNLLIIVLVELKSYIYFEFFLSGVLFRIIITQLWSRGINIIKQWNEISYFNYNAEFQFYINQYFYLLIAKSLVLQPKQQDVLVLLVKGSINGGVISQSQNYIVSIFLLIIQVEGYIKQIITFYDVKNISIQYQFCLKLIIFVYQFNAIISQIQFFLFLIVLFYIIQLRIQEIYFPQILFLQKTREE
ncbi:hypothetical protein pb186bvf_019826 [Paramecium bursaria]